MKKRLLIILAAFLLVFGLLPASALASEDHWAASAVETLNDIYGEGVFTISDAVMDTEDAQLILSGMGCTTQLITGEEFTRGMACAVLADVFDLQCGEKSAIEYLDDNNILTGAAGGDLNEEGEVTQAQFAVLTYRVLNSVGGGLGSSVETLKPGTDDYFNWMYLAARSCVSFDAKSTVGNITEAELGDWVGKLNELKEGAQIQISAPEVTEETTKLVAAAQIVSEYIKAGGPGTIFSDVAPGNAFYDGVMYLFDQGIIQGYGDGEFGVEDVVIREQFASLLCRIDNYTFEGFGAAQAYVTGKGYMDSGDDASWWEENVTRQEVIVGLLKQMKVDVSTINTSILDRFTADKGKISAEAEPYLAYAVSLGLVKGTGNGSISPEADITRGQCGMLLYRAMLGVDKTKMQDYRESVDYALGKTAAAARMRFMAAPLAASEEKTLILREDWRLTDVLDLSVPADTHLIISGGQIYEMGGRLINSGAGTYSFAAGYSLFAQNAAEVNGKYYTSLGEAISAASDGATVYLLKDTTENVTVPAGKIITLQGGNNTLYGTISCEVSTNDDSIVTTLSLFDITLNGDTDNDGVNEVDYAVISANQQATTVSGLELTMNNCTVQNYAKKAIYLTNAVKLDIDECAFYNNATEEMDDPNTYGDYTIDLNLMNVDAGSLSITNTTFEGVCGDKAVIKVSARGGDSDTWAGQDIPVGTQTTISSLAISGCSFNDNPAAAADLNIGTDSKADKNGTDGSFAANTTGAFSVAISRNITAVEINEAYKTYMKDGNYFEAAGDGTGTVAKVIVPVRGSANKTEAGDMVVSAEPPIIEDDSNVTTYAISISSKVENGTIKISPTRASEGTPITVTVTPDEGYELDELTVTDRKGNEIELKNRVNGKYTFTMPASNVEIAVSFAEVLEQQINPFIDIYESDYYYNAVLWAVANGVTTGTTDITFSPNVTVSRAQMVTFLWRAAGSPEIIGNNPFTDVAAGAYYYNAVLWAVANGVTNGTTDTTFSPDAPVSRAQAVTFQWRAAGYPAVFGGSFDDVTAGAYYESAVVWAVANGITNGSGGNNFGPEIFVSRAQAVTFIYRERL